MASTDAKRELTDADQNRIDGAVKHFEENRQRVATVAKSMIACFEDDSKLRQLIHFLKYRVKDPQSLRDKLFRMASNDRYPPVDESNLFQEVRDLAGIRIIHLHADQIADLHKRIMRVLDEHSYQLIGDPIAYCWDLDYQELFGKIGLNVQPQSSMYTTVHYDVLAHESSGIACELQVRSLADELWGEVSHRVNYPTESPSEACRDQLKVLARLTSGCGRLVDSIFKTHRGAVAKKP